MKSIPISTSVETLPFLKPANTSKLSYGERKILLIHAQMNGFDVSGECAPLPHLSAETLDECIALVANMETFPNQEQMMQLPSSLKFAFEGMRLEALIGQIPKTNIPIAINGLIWMNGFDTMWEELMQKTEAGFDCIKIKIGQHDFDSECRFLERVRKHFKDTIELRLDANGAFQNADALLKLKDLSKFKIHSIEQPIQQGHWENMQEICAKSAIPIALDEELIGITSSQQTALIKTIKPQFLVLKPTLHGGFENGDAWIKEAAKNHIQWWATSALESNIGLYQIALWLSTYHIKLPQGLGTGKLFKTNYDRPFHYQGRHFVWGNPKVL